MIKTSIVQGRVRPYGNRRKHLRENRSINREIVNQK
jgi:hypothetical protein